jgi:hypothetical protein
MAARPVSSRGLRWCMAPMKKLGLVLFSSLMVSCAHFSPIYWGYGEWAAGDTAGVENDLLVEFDWSKVPGVITSIDGKRLGEGYKKAKLLSGRHVIEYANYSVEFGGHQTGMLELDLAAGHSYQFGLKLCYWCHPRKYAVWVDDKTTGEVVWGKHPDWPAWWL